MNPRAHAAPASAWWVVPHALLGLWIGLAGFHVVLALLIAATAATPALLLGLPLFSLAFWVARLLGRMERARFGLFGRVHIEPPVPTDRPSGALAWLHADLADPANWRLVGYHLARLPLSVVEVVALMTVPSGLFLMSLPIWAGQTWQFLAAVAGLLVAGLGAWTLPRLTGWLARVEVSFARRLLGPDPATARIRELESSRSALLAAADAERRRIERDLHDGAQQRLVTLAMTLGRARSRWDTAGPDAVRPLVDEAHADAKLALRELRDLARGLHPAVLTDRGLDAALSGLAARAPVPVRVEVVVDAGAGSARRGPASDGRPAEAGSPRVAESVAYFIVAEALTNVARHAQARSASVVVRRTAGRLHLVVGDDGVGGADPARGSGLRGLADRVAGLDGTFTVQSPTGGPTVLTVELPC
jgi:signal transduction histidine kinase